MKWYICVVFSIVYGMKKTIFAFIMALTVGFTAAVGLCVQVLLAPKSVSAFDNGMRIVLDAGHGGMDGGVVGRATKVKESDLNLTITYALKTALEDMGFEIVLTRKTEAGLYDAFTKGFKKRDMQKRKEIIEDADPVLVISVHQNFYPSKQVRGGQVFYHAKNEGSKKLALSLQERLNALYGEEGVKEKTAKMGEFFMLDCASCPSVIVECGFLSNTKDEALLVSAQWQKNLANCLAAGVLDYFSSATA